MGIWDEVMNKVAMKMTLDVFGLLLVSPPPDMATQFDRVSCVVSNWEPWGSCEGNCVDNRVAGYRVRHRFYNVDGYKLSMQDLQQMYTANGRRVPSPCLYTLHTTEIKTCEDLCLNPDKPALRPGDGEWKSWEKVDHSWGSWKK